MGVSDIVSPRDSETYDKDLVDRQNLELGMGGQHLPDRYERREGSLSESHLPGICFEPVWFEKIWWWDNHDTS
jgi:hypothetical protein